MDTRSNSIKWDRNWSPQLDIRTRGLPHGHVSAILCSVTTVRTTFSQQLLPVTKVGATSLSPNRNRKVCNEQADSPPPKKFKILHIITGEVKLLFFFDSRSPLLVDFLEHGATVNAQWYLETLTKLRKAIKLKRPCKLSSVVIVLHNARRHTAKVTKKRLQ